MSPFSFPHSYANKGKTTPLFVAFRRHPTSAHSVLPLPYNLPTFLRTDASIQNLSAFRPPKCLPETKVKEYARNQSAFREISEQWNHRASVLGSITRLPTQVQWGQFRNLAILFRRLRSTLKSGVARTSALVTKPKVPEPTDWGRCKCPPEASSLLRLTAEVYWTWMSWAISHVLELENYFRRWFYGCIFFLAITEVSSGIGIYTKRNR